MYFLTIYPEKLINPDMYYVYSTFVRKWNSASSNSLGLMPLKERKSCNMNTCMLRVEPLHEQKPLRVKYNTLFKIT